MRYPRNHDLSPLSIWAKQMIIPDLDTFEFVHRRYHLPVGARLGAYVEHLTEVMEYVQITTEKEYQDSWKQNLQSN